MFSPMSVYLLLAKSKLFQVYWSVDFVVLSVCLFVCLSPTGHNFKQIFTKLHHMLEFVKRKKPIVFEVKRSTKAKFLKLIIFISLTWNLKRSCKSGHLIQPPITFEVNLGQKANIGQRSTTKVESLKSSIFIPLTWSLKRIYISGYWI